MTNGDHVDIYSKTFAGDLSEGCLHAVILNADAISRPPSGVKRTWACS